MLQGFPRPPPLSFTKEQFKMAITLLEDVVNRFIVNSPADHTVEEYSGNTNVSAINSVLVYSRKENVKVFARVTATQVWETLGVVGNDLNAVSGHGTEYRKDAVFNVTTMDRVSIISLGAETTARIVFNPSLPTEALSNATPSGSTASQTAVTAMAKDQSETITIDSGTTPLIQVFEDIPPTAGSEVLSYTGSDQSFVVPAGVTSLTAKLWGAGGSGGSDAPNNGQYGDGGKGGAAGYTTGTIAVTPGETLTLVVGQGGSYSYLTATAATYGGGGNSPDGQTMGPGGGGGGYAGIFRGSISQPNALLIAGGGGGGAGHYTTNNDAGTGGGLSGTAGQDATSGGAGTQSAGGVGFVTTVPGTDGSALQGGNGGLICGAGGAGYFGGGGGGHTGSSGTSASGGGGSSFLGTATAASTTAGSGVLPPQQGDADYIAGVGLGGDRQTAGGNALIALSYSTGGSTKTLNKTSDYEVHHLSDTSVKITKLTAGSADVKIRLI